MSSWELEVRPRRAARIAIASAVIVFAAFTIGGIFLRSRSTGVTFDLADQIAMILLGAAMAGTILLLTRSRLRVGESGVVVRNLVSDKHIPWDMVRGLSFQDGKAWARVELPADEYIPVLALRASDKSRAADAVEQFRTIAGQYAS